MVDNVSVVVSNTAARYSSIVIWLIWLFGLYGVISSRLWPPTGLRDVLAQVSIVLLPVVGVRMLRARIVMDEDGLTSWGEVRTRRYLWDQVVGFRVRGNLIQNKVGVDLSDGDWVPLQYHPFGADMVTILEKRRLELAARRAEPERRTT